MRLDSPSPRYATSTHATSPARPRIVHKRRWIWTSGLATHRTRRHRRHRRLGSRCHLPLYLPGLFPVSHIPKRMWDSLRRRGRGAMVSRRAAGSVRVPTGCPCLVLHPPPMFVLHDKPDYSFLFPYSGLLSGITPLDSVPIPGLTVYPSMWSPVTPSIHASCFLFLYRVSSRVPRLIRHGSIRSSPHNTHISPSYPYSSMHCTYITLIYLILDYYTHYPRNTHTHTPIRIHIHNPSTPSRFRPT